MPRFDYVVTVECESREQAETVMAEHLAAEVDCGFDYSVWDWEITGDPDGYGE